MDTSKVQIALHPVIYVRADRVAEIFGCPLEVAEKLLSQPDSRPILMNALSQAFTKTVDEVLYQMMRQKQIKLPDLRQDCVVELPTGVEAKLMFGL